MYKIIDPNTYYRAGVYKHFTKDCKCSVSITGKIDVTELLSYSRNTQTKFYINFLYVLSKTLNARDDYKMAYLWETAELVVFEQINPCHYIFHDDTETCTPVYSRYYEDYSIFYAACKSDIEQAKTTRSYGLDMVNHPNWFDASYISWLTYEALHIELPDGHLYFMPIINWGKYTQDNGRLLMPVTVRLNHAVADGYLVAKVFSILQEQIHQLTK